MPELPEVETTVRGLNKTIKGLVIKDAWTNYNSPFHKTKDNIKNPSFFNAFRKHIVGAKVVKTERKAKNILIHLNTNKTILVHMKMTGHLLFGLYNYDKKTNIWKAVDSGPLQDPFNQHIRLVLVFKNGRHLALSDMRKFAKVTLIQTKELDTSSELSLLGPEPLSPLFTPQMLKSRLLLRPNGKIKSVLMDQRIVSGIGNIYSDEILWASGIHPESRVVNLPPSQIRRIHNAIKTILALGIDFKGDSMSDYRRVDGRPGKFQHHHNAYRQTGKRCSKSKCLGTIARKVIGGRSAHFCNSHQILFQNTLN